jgi:tetratricopeptide (TPR) repeat protein
MFHHSRKGSMSPTTGSSSRVPSGDEKIRSLLALADAALNEEFPPNIEAAFDAYQQALELDENNVDALDAFGELLANLGDSERAIQILMKSAHIAPEVGPSKYFYLGQMLAGHDALCAYKKCYSLMEQQSGNPEILEKMVATLCAIGELFTTDLADEDNAEALCAEAFSKAVALNSNSIEALNGLATFHRIKLEINESKELCSKAFDILAEAIESSEIDLQDVAPLGLRQRFAENLVELEMVDEALAVLSTILEEDEEDIQSWFLTACCHLVGKQHEEARECLKQAKRLLKKHRNNLPSQIVEHWTKNLNDLEQRMLAS